MALIALRGKVGRVDKYTYWIALVLPFVTLGLFEGIRHWGAGPTIIVLTASPVVNVVIGASRGRRTSRASILGLVLLLGGVVMARWGGTFNWTGFSWSLFGTIMSGILNELFGRAKSAPMNQCFWGSIGMGVLGLALSAGASWAPAAQPKVDLSVLGFAVIGGFLYWKSYLLAFKNLPTTEASVLAQGETPAVIVGATVLLGEHLTLAQWIAVAIALYGAYHVARSLSTKEVEV